ncbi:2-succinyl-5-enolpyruvyl-6-hydroxy-3-cyclohexene-1-carboxylic-acid synthase [Fulvivirga imtechensis AK7]|uniref:2-succinyl-5-enolpyruvyl-6-hydroxy-3-cyclohexene-1-carboxylic-acid synthase n=1 Tax=Fulvivirga imtechensis AK7 TaxID=1237149 RepID=L8JWW2_9BACT|nr:2-succinyl-5-enolpyruvyl-6-hydroxy-3-cyclohexene-1-carboxylic-acid synthase [Fulvivirga imtechensis AK7]
MAEAYFQQIPLVVITADRPPELIDQLDGQTIRQTGIFGRHVKMDYNFPVDLDSNRSKWHAHRITSEAVNCAKEFPQGPVHINIPLREPFYPEGDDEIGYDKDIQVIYETTGTRQLTESQWEELVNTWKGFNRILIVGGQDRFNSSLNAPLEKIIATQKIPVAGDIISNLHAVDGVVRHADLFLGQDKNGLQASLQPDLLVTFGKSIISKNLKLLLRKHQPQAHWHIQQAGYVADTYQSLTKVIKTDAITFFGKISDIEFEASFNNQKQENYYHIWQIEERKSKRIFDNFFPQDPLGEFEFIREMINHLPDNCNLHLANSMAVRYANFVGLDNPTIEVFANRGTSGIDGSSSTAVGHCLTNDKMNVLITGDLAFFYDRNAFWHNYNIKNLRVILLNNHAGGIFRIINGPDKLAELEEYFETHQKLNARLTAEEFGFEYFNCDKRSKLDNYRKNFFEPGSKPKIIELESSSIKNTALLKNFKSSYKSIK